MASGEEDRIEQRLKTRMAVRFSDLVGVWMVVSGTRVNENIPWTGLLLGLTSLTGPGTVTLILSESSLTKIMIEDTIVKVGMLRGPREGG